MPELKELTDKIQNAVNLLHQAGDRQQEELKRIGDITAETKSCIEKINDEIDAQKARLDSLETKLERHNVPSIGGRDDEMEAAYKTAFYKWIRGGREEMTSNDWKTLRTALPEERKALVENTAGLYLVPQELEQEIIRAVPQINRLRDYCRVRTTRRDKVSVNSMTEVSIGWGKLETGTTITESTPTPSQDDIYAEDLYGLTKVGEDELQDTDANLATILADSFSVAIANEEAKQFAVGRGHDTYSEPAGVALDATIIASYKTDWTTVDTAATEDMLTCEYSLGKQYLNGAAWLMNRKTELALRLLRAEVAAGYYGNYLWQPSLTAGAPNQFDGYPIINQNDMNYPADATLGINVIFGNFRLGYMILERSGIAIQRLDELYAEDGLVGFKIHRRLGGGVYRPAAFYGIYNNT